MPWYSTVVIPLLTNLSPHPISTLYTLYTLSKKIITWLWYQICKTPKTHVTLFINTIHISLIIALIRTNKSNVWDITAVPKDKALNTNIGYNIAKQRLLTYTLKHSQYHIQTVSYNRVFKPQMRNSTVRLQPQQRKFTIYSPRVLKNC